MVIRCFIGESCLARRRFFSHISGVGLKSIQNRHYIKFPRIFSRKNPEIVSSSSVNLHDQSTGFTSFVKSLDSLMLSNQSTTESFIDLFERFEPSLSDDNEHILNSLASHDTGSLLFMLDSLTLYMQTKKSKNITNLLNNLCSVLSKKDLMKSESDEFDIRYNMAIMDVLNRIDHESFQVKALKVSVNEQLRSNVDFLIENGNFTHFMDLFSYTLDPRTMYTIVYCCLFKLDRFKCSDYCNLPKFLFKFKIYDENILSNVVSYASTSPHSLFESDSKSFSRFVKGLLLFERVCNNNDISYSPTVLYLTKLKDKITLYSDNEILFLLAGFPSQRHFDGSAKNVLLELVDSMLVKMGILCELKKFKSISHLDNNQLVGIVKYINKLELKTHGYEWKDVKSFLLKGKDGQATEELSYTPEENEFLNEFAKDFSNRFLREVSQNCSLGDIDVVFMRPEVVSELMVLLNTFHLSNVEEIYVNSIGLSLKRLLSLVVDSDFEESELVKFYRDISKLNSKFLTEFSLQLYNLGNRNNVELLEKASRFKLLYLKADNKLSDTHEVLENTDSFEALKGKNNNSVESVLNLLDLINKAKELSEDGNKKELSHIYEKFSGILYDCISKKFSLFNYKSMLLILNLPPDSTLLTQLDSLIDMEMKNVKIPQLVTIFIYKLRRIYEGKERFEGAKKVQEELCSQLEELTGVLESSFGQRMWVSEPTNNNYIKKINPWANENGLKALFRTPREQYDIFLHEKCNRIDNFFDIKKYKEMNEDEQENSTLIGSLHDLKMELIELGRQISKEEIEVGLKWNKNELFEQKEMISTLVSQIRKVILTVEMCRPISRNYHLPKKHTKELIKLCYKQIKGAKVANKNNV